MRFFGQHDRRRLAALLVMGLVFVGSAWWLFEDAVQQLLEADAMTRAHDQADLLASTIPEIDRILEGGGVSTAVIDFVQKTQRIDPVFSFRVFDSQGRVRLDGRNPTGAVDKVKLSDDPAAREAARTGQITLNTGRGDGVDRPIFYAAAYAPLHVQGRRLGAIEVYIDQTDEAKAVRSEVSLAALGIAALTAFGFLLAIAGYLLQSREARQIISFVSRHDDLTQLHNRSAFKAIVDAQTARSQADGDEFDIFFVDLDRFKNVNDSRGHAAGDEVLRQVAARLKDIAGPRGEVSRLGGDEFAVFHPVERATDSGLGEHIVTALSRPFDFEGLGAEIGASVGVSRSPRDGSTSEALLKAADIALYEAKDGGRGRCVRFEASMQDQVQRRLSLEARLKAALAQDQFSVYYQPLVNADRLAGFEALLRLWDDNGDPIAPAIFIPVAEQLGLISAIGKQTLETACRTAALWPDDLKVAVNLSPLQFEPGDLVATVKAALAASHLPPHRLELEVTESVLISDTRGVLRQLEELKQLGVSIALDDFGTGYSSLSYLWMFPFDRVKVDRSFVSRLSDQDPKSRDILSSILALGRSLEMSITAEGVETVEQSTILRTLKVDTVQGYLYGRPVPETELAVTILRLRAGFEAAFPSHAGIRDRGESGAEPVSRARESFRRAAGS